MINKAVDEDDFLDSIKLNTESRISRNKNTNRGSYSQNTS